ncbi:MAG: RNA polymerase sigma factor [Deltaproteobacteria bacterium]|nr:RNA polymerase sigma factor [Deltaproteobacteria bacterium]
MAEDSAATSISDALDLETAFVHHARALERFFVRAGCRADAEDLVAETFLIAHQNQERFDHTRPLLPWLYGIAVKLSRKNLRKRWMRSLLNHAVLRFDPPEPLSMLAQLIDVEDVARLHDVLRAMPESKRVILILREWQGLTPHEVAEALSIPEGSVHSALHYARKELIRRYRQRLAIEGSR